MESLRAILKRSVDVNCWCDPETMPYVGNCSAIDPVTDAATEAYIRDQLDAGNEWAWCVVTVRVTLYYGGARGNRTAIASIGGCCYSSKADFVKAGDYYDDLLNEALDTLMDEIRDDAAMLKSLGLKITGAVL